MPSGGRADPGPGAPGDGRARPRGMLARRSRSWPQARRLGPRHRLPARRPAGPGRRPRPPRRRPSSAARSAPAATRRRRRPTAAPTTPARCSPPPIRRSSATSTRPGSATGASRRRSSAATASSSSAPTGPDGKPGEFEIAYTFGVDPLQQYLVPFPGGRLQALGLAWDTRPRGPGRPALVPPLSRRNAARPGPASLDGPRADVELPVRRVPLDGPPEAVRPGRRTRYATAWAELTVSCEECHGPGSAHVAWAESAPGRAHPARRRARHRPRRAPRAGRRRRGP